MRMKRNERIAALFAGALVILALLAVFAVELSDNQAKSRQDIKNRVHERAVQVKDVAAEVSLWNLDLH